MQAEIKWEAGALSVRMQDVQEALKVIAVFSEYEYKGAKINLCIK